MRKNIYAVTLLLLIAACDDSNGPRNPPRSDAVFIDRGLDGIEVVALEQTASTLIAATSSGIYKYVGGDDWVLVSPADWKAIAITALYPCHLLASVETPAGEFRLVESLNSGDSWNAVGNNFGGTDNSQSEPIKAIRFDDASGVLFATGYDVLARSSDFGRSWAVVNGAWQGFATGLSALKYSSQYRDIWYGGQDAIENPSLRRTDRDTGGSENLSTKVSELLERPSTIKSVVFYPFAEQTVFVSGEGGVLRSTDYGQSWSPVLVNETSRFYFDVVVDAKTGTAYSAGWDKDYDNPQPLILDFSNDGGQTWQSREYQGAAIQGGVWSLLLAEFGKDQQLFIGLQGGGVYEVEMENL